MLKKEQIKIQDATYEVTQLGFFEGRALYHKLLKSIAPVLESLVSKQEGDFSFDSVGSEDMAKAISVFIKTSQSEVLFEISDALMEKTRINLGTDKWAPLKDIADMYFGGNYEGWAAWLIFACKVNFLDFLFVDGGSSDGSTALENLTQQ